MNRDEIEKMAYAAIQVEDVTAKRCEAGFIEVMAKKSPSVRKDIAAASEMYALLIHFLHALPFKEKNLAEELADINTVIEPGIYFDDKNGKLLSMIKIESGDFTHVCYWLAENLPSAQIKQMPGVLAIPFSIETYDGIKHLLPEWFFAYYIDGNPDQCVPGLALKSIILDGKFGGDWVGTALHRMPAFGMPSQKAIDSIKTKVT